MSSQDLDDVFARAAAIAGKVPKNLQEAAFNRAVDHLMKSGTARSNPTPERKDEHKPAAGGSDSTPAPLSMDRTRLPDIAATSRLADRALKVLYLALHEYDHDGLTAAEISQILTGTFRLPAKPNAVAMALARETKTVNLRRDGSRNVFHIMQPGEEYLNALRTKPPATSVPSAAPRQARPRKEVVETPRPPAKKAAAAEKKSTARRGGTGTGRPGPKAAVERLIGRGYFDSARTISEVRSELKHGMGFDFTLQELSPSLVRLLREGQLKRDRNADEQYEYRV